jgi:hypothetical protein
VRQAQLVLSGMVAELSPDIRRRLLASPGGKVALFSRPQQAWTDIPEHSIWKGSEFGAHDLAGAIAKQRSNCSGQTVLSSCSCRNLCCRHMCAVCGWQLSSSSRRFAVGLVNLPARHLRKGCSYQGIGQHTDCTKSNCCILLLQVWAAL